MSLRHVFVKQLAYLRTAQEKFEELSKKYGFGDYLERFWKFCKMWKTWHCEGFIAKLQMLVMLLFENPGDVEVTPGAPADQCSSTRSFKGWKWKTVWFLLGTWMPDWCWGCTLPSATWTAESSREFTGPCQGISLIKLLDKCSDRIKKRYLSVFVEFHFAVRGINFC